MSNVQQEQAVLIKIFHEVPDKNLANLAMILLICISCVLLVVTVITKSWFMLILPITGFLIAGGYAFRIAMISDPSIKNIGGMYMLLIVPALLLALANYECIGKITDAKLIPIIFIIIDILCLLLQIYGATTLTSTNVNTIHTGLNFILAGLLLAIIVNIFFIFILFKVQKNTNFPREFWICLYVTMILLLTRNVYKSIEFIQSRMTSDGQGYIATHEIYMYLFDFSTIFVSLVIFTVLHYGFYLKS